MRLLPQYADALSPSAAPLSGDDEAVMGLQASLRSSAALRAILECARERPIGEARVSEIEQMCRRYEEHHKAVRDHCLDYYNIRPECRGHDSVSRRTKDLVSQGKALYSELREAILTF